MSRPPQPAPYKAPEPFAPAGPRLLSPIVRKSVIFDVDGTLSDPTHRRHLLDGDPPDWGTFKELCGDDKVNPDIAELASLFYGASYVILVVSGREEKYRQQTRLWLTFGGIHCDHLFMRGDHDQRHDDLVKADILVRIRAAGFDPRIAVDDRARVVKMWREHGLTCLQCAPGDF